jgi:hypothetical protein
MSFSAATASATSSFATIRTRLPWDSWWTM